MRFPAQTIDAILNDPSLIRTASQAKQLHAQLFKLHSTGTRFRLSTSLILSIYSNFSLFQESCFILNSFHFPPPSRAWKAIIKCSSSTGHFKESIGFYKKMRELGKAPDQNVFPSLLKTCSYLRDLKLGEAFHGCVIRFGLEGDLYTGNALMNMYAKLESLGARKLFDGLPQLNTSSGFVGDSEGLVLRTSVGKIFEVMPNRDVVSYNTVIGGYVQNGMHEEALLSVRSMADENLKPDSFTLSSVLPVFACYVDVMKGKEIHGYAIRHGFGDDVFIGSSLIDMYANCERLEDSFRVFSLSPRKDYVLWNSIIAAHVQNGRFDEGLRLFREMLLSNIKPVSSSFSSIMPACAHLTAILLGKQLHGYIIRHGFDENIYIASSLVDMYAKCGNLKISRWIFDNMEIQDVVSWTAMIMGYAIHGHAREAVSLFENMEIKGVRPTAPSFVAVLTACSHAGLVDEGWKYFRSMTRDYAISPEKEHYAAVSDLLGRAGKLNEAYDFISSMHIKPTAAIWSTLLSACRVQKNVELAEKVAKEMFVVDPDNISSHLLLMDVYIAAGRWKDAAKLRKRMRKKGMTKEAACSWIEVKNEVHIFMAGYEHRPDFPQIHIVLQDLLEKMELEEHLQTYMSITS